MNEITRIHKSKQPRRPHYIEEWAEHRGFKTQADLAAELDVDKSVVSRWYAGSTPNEESQTKLAAVLQTDPESLFRHPDDDWFAKFFQNRSREELERMKTALEASFPKRASADKKEN